MKNLRIDDLVYVLLLELSKKKHKKPEVYLEELVKEKFKDVK